MKKKYRILLGTDDLYNKKTEEVAIFAAVGRNTCKLYQIMTAHGEYKLIEDSFWTMNQYFCDTVIGAKALIEQLERYAEKEADDYDWEQDETDYYWATR
jgi:hypothetical protein